MIDHKYFDLSLLEEKFAQIRAISNTQRDYGNFCAKYLYSLLLTGPLSLCYSIVHTPAPYGQVYLGCERHLGVSSNRQQSRQWLVTDACNGVRPLYSCAL